MKLSNLTIKTAIAVSLFTVGGYAGALPSVVVAEESAITSGLLNLGRSKYHSEDESTAVEGSVVPTLSMEEQIVPCKVADGETPRILVNVSGIKSDSGNVRVAVYGNDPDEFLKSGKAVSRVDVPSRVGEMMLCVELPQEGEYSMAVLHDVNANGRAEIFTEGFGFSNNPSIGFSVPDYEEVSFTSANGVKEMKVALNYVFGNEQQERRRRSRR